MRFQQLQSPWNIFLNPDQSQQTIAHHYLLKYGVTGLQSDQKFKDNNKINSSPYACPWIPLHMYIS